MKVEKFIEKMEFPEEVQVAVQNNEITVKGPKGEVKKTFDNPRITIKLEGNELVFDIPEFTKNEKTMLGTIKAHFKNMIKGVTEGHEYVMKVCSGHFPMNISMKNNVFEVKNYLGEKIPRTQKISEQVELKIEGDNIMITGIDKEAVAQAAASIEQLTRRAKFDRRIFQDGIYIVNKDGKEIK